MNKTIIQLTDEEVRLAKYIGRKRHEESSKTRPNMKRSNKSDEEIDELGALGEFAVCKYLNVFFDVRTKHNGKLPVEDLTTHNGTTVDVKTTQHYHNQYLIVYGHKDYAEAFVFVVGDESTFEILGYIRAEDALKEENTLDVGYGKSYAVKQSDLIKF